MSWTNADDLRTQVQTLWDKGALLAQLVPAQSPPPLFPLRLRLRGPSSSDFADRFSEVRAWIATLRASEKSFGWRIVWREVQHRVVGANLVPAAIWLDSLADALAVLGKQADAERFVAMAEATLVPHPELRPWLLKNALKLLALEAAWPRLLAVLAWVISHPRSGIFLRQVSVTAVSGVDSKFIETHRAVLAELLDIALPFDAIDTRFIGVSEFALRYGFRDKPLRIRLRLLDPTMPLIAPGTDQDITLTQAAFATLGDALGESLQRVFVTENEVNFLAFPSVPRSVVVFGAGYGFEALSDAAWLHRLAVHYWGDIDTHGFAILDQLRAQLPHAQSLMMDRATLMAHQAQWGVEPQPTTRDLPRLTAAERDLYDELRLNGIQPKLRLEQERIGFDWVQQSVWTLAKE